MPQFGTQNLQPTANPMMGMGNPALSADETQGQIPSSIPSTPEGRRQDLARKFEDVKSLDRNVRSQKIINKNKLAEAKSKVIRELFTMMQNLGVDPSDLESINQFLQTLEQQDPDLRELFEVAFNTLISDRDVNPMADSMAQEQEQGNGGLMDKYSNLARGMMQSR